jgi:carbon storage regulator
MLVLERKLNERILIGDDIVITVAAISGDQVRLGIEAPRNIAVDREEVRWRKMLDWWRSREQ